MDPDIDPDIDPGLLTTVRVAPEFGADPLWLTFSDDPVPLNYSPEWLPGNFGVPGELAAALRRWDDELQAVYVPWDPMASGFVVPDVAMQWDAHGLELARRLAAALDPAVRVEFRAASGDVLVRRGGPVPPPAREPAPGAAGQRAGDTGCGGERPAGSERGDGC